MRRSQLSLFDVYGGRGEGGGGVTAEIFQTLIDRYMYIYIY